jgi:hypothetical protein
MKAVVFAIALFAIFGSSAAEYTGCLHKANYSAFNLCPFSKESKNFTETILGEYNSKITFGLGSNHIKSCNQTASAWAKIEDDLATQCFDVAEHDPEFSLINPINSTEGIRITFPQEKRAANTFDRVVVELTCDMKETTINQTKFTVKKTSDEGGFNHTYTITGSSRFGCPAVSFEQLINFIYSNNVVFAIIFTVVGLILTFAGLKFINFAIFTITATAGTMVSGMFLYQFTDITASQWVFWVLFFVCLVLGLALGYAALKFEKVAIALVGGVLGFVGAEILYGTVINKLLTSPANPNIFRVFVILGAIIGGTLAFLLFETVFIIATSLIGSYMIIRCISIFTGHFPAEISVADGVAQFDGYAYGYFAAILILALVGIKIQWSQHMQKKQEINDIEKGSDNSFAYYRNK